MRLAAKKIRRHMLMRRLASLLFITLVSSLAIGCTAATPDHITIKGEDYSTSLTTLDLASKELTSSDIEPLKHMKKLNILILSYNEITDISVLAGLTSLEYLSLNENKVDDIEALKSLANLKILAIQGNWDLIGTDKVDELRAALPLCDVQITY